MRCHPLRWLWGLIPIVMLSWIAVHTERERIERDLEQRALAALRRAGHDWASVAFSGRDGLLVGTPPRSDDPVQAVALVGEVWGVRSVVARMRVHEAAVAAPTPELPTRRPREDRIALPPLAATVTAVKAPAEAKAWPTPPPTVTAAQPAGLAESHPDTLHVWEQPVAADDERPTDAQKSQDRPSPAALETAAIAAAHTASAASCEAAVQAINASEPMRFPRNKYQLDRRSREALDRLAAAVGTCPQVGLKVVGHADARGRAKRNLALSQRRARAVVTYLIDKGIDAGRLKAVGYGEARPLAPNDTAQNRAKNRRIELEITKAGAAAQASPTGQGAGNGLPDR